MISAEMPWWHEPAGAVEVRLAVALRSSLGPNGAPPAATLVPIGTRLIDSTPAAITTSYAPAITPWAAKCSDCWLEPHCRSTLVPHTVSGKPAASAALRPMLTPCSPTWLDAAHDHVLDQRGIDARALDQRLQRVCGQIDGVDGLKGSGLLAAAERGADGVDDDCFTHGMVSLAELGWAPGGAAHD